VSLQKEETTDGAARLVVVLGTGGTIAGAATDVRDNVGYQAASLAVEDLLGHLSADAGPLQAEQVAQVDSKDMDFGVWQALALRCAHWLAQDDVQGVVVTHGTDTLEETAYFLHRVLASRKPVVLVSAMRPATALAPDGPQNLRDAMALVRTPGVSGVLTVCAGRVHGAQDVRKEHTYRLDAFGSGDAGPIAYVEEGAVRQVRAWPCAAPNGRWLELVAQLAVPPRVDIVLSHAGADGRIVDALLALAPAARPAGLVVAGTGNGSIHAALLAALQRAQAAGVRVWRTTRCAYGSVLAAGGHPLPMAPDLSAVKARIALMLELAGA